MIVRAAGVMVSCKIPILATRVRFPGGANFFTEIIIIITVDNQTTRIYEKTKNTKLHCCSLLASPLLCPVEWHTVATRVA